MIVTQVDKWIDAKAWHAGQGQQLTPLILYQRCVHACMATRRQGCMHAACRSHCHTLMACSNRTLLMLGLGASMDTDWVASQLKGLASGIPLFASYYLFKAGHTEVFASEALSVEHGLSVHTICLSLLLLACI